MLLLSISMAHAVETLIPIDSLPREEPIKVNDTQIYFRQVIAGDKN